MTANAQIAVYIDFENIVASEFDRRHGPGSFRAKRMTRRWASAEGLEQLRAAKVNLSAVYGYLASLGSVALNRAYGDWSQPWMHMYAHDLQRHSVDLVQLFPLTGTKNGADIRLAIDAVEDLVTSTIITDVVVVGGDSDYVALAQRIRRLGGRVRAIAVRGSVAPGWQQACDEFQYLDALDRTAMPAEPAAPEEQAAAPIDPIRLLRSAVAQLLKRTEGEAVPRTNVKQVMLRLDPTFTEADHGGHRTFTAFLEAAAEAGHITLVRNGTELLVALANARVTAEEAAEPEEMDTALREALDGRQLGNLSFSPEFWTTMDALVIGLPAHGPLDDMAAIKRYVAEHLGLPVTHATVRACCLALHKLTDAVRRRGTHYEVLVTDPAEFRRRAVQTVVDLIRAADVPMTADRTARLLRMPVLPAEAVDMVERAWGVATAQTYEVYIGHQVCNASAIWRAVRDFAAIPVTTNLSTADLLRPWLTNLPNVSSRTVQRLWNLLWQAYALTEHGDEIRPTPGTDRVKAASLVVKELVDRMQRSGVPIDVPAFREALTAGVDDTDVPSWIDAGLTRAGVAHDTTAA